MCLNAWNAWSTQDIATHMQRGLQRHHGRKFICGTTDEAICKSRLVHGTGGCSSSLIFLSKCITMRSTGLDHSIQLTAYHTTSPFELKEYTIPETLQDCTVQLRHAKSVVNRIVKESYARRDAERNH
jgi:hypothetical protein